jgi:hypothetical protein
MVSASLSGGFERVILHLEGSKTAVFEHKALARLGQLEIRPIDVSDLARAVGADPLDVCRLYDEMRGPAARADVVRALVLASEGGVYLDLDTVTLADFTRLRQQASAFVGQERICFPGWSAGRPKLSLCAKAYGLAALRFGLAAAPRGYRLFSKLSPWYSLWVNNAVIGCEPNHLLLRAYVAGMLELPLDEARRRYAIGPDLLNRVCRECVERDGSIVRLDPSYFYPLPPVICDHWWKLTEEPRLEDVLSPSTLAVHWYASVRSKTLTHSVDLSYILCHKDRQLFSRMAHRYKEAF